MENEQIDWKAAEEFAAGMSRTHLVARIEGYRSDLVPADTLDLELGTNRGGLYRDQISVLRRELARRSKKGTCSECGCKEHGPSNLRSYDC